MHILLRRTKKLLNAVCIMLKIIMQKINEDTDQKKFIIDQFILNVRPLQTAITANSSVIFRFNTACQMRFNAYDAVFNCLNFLPHENDHICIAYLGGEH